MTQKPQTPPAPEPDDADRRPDDEPQEEDLDQALEETFPASDPISP